MQLTRFTGFGGPSGGEILCFVTLVEQDRAVEVISAPLEQLFESRVVFAGSVTFADERGISGEDDSLLDFSVVFG